MNKHLKHIVFTFALVFVMNLQITAQTKFDLTFEQQVEGNELYVDVFVQKTSGDDIVLGGFNLPFRDLGSDLDLANAQIIETGKFSFEHAPDSYVGPMLNDIGSLHLYFLKKQNASGAGETLGSEREKIVRLTIPILNDCGNSNLVWVTDRGTLTDFNNRKIKGNASFVNPGKFEFKPQLSAPIIVEKEGVLSASLSPSYQWNLNGQPMPGATNKDLIMSDEGEYSVTTTDGCTSLTSEIFDYSKAGPQLTVDAYPNPYVSNTTISYNLPEEGKVSLRVYDISGTLIKTIFEGYQDKGQYQFDFSAQASSMSSGVYYAKLTVGERAVSQQLIELTSN